ncbi:amino acid permease [Tersicoccus phoenicis]|uniref:Amino acid permease n=1 Tax=Tersicoccus phoenicis TaxID=554083 RepID=A0A1R1LJ83_9MICC|nr:amino acid permease [Tersicoccus phoenicis]OMH27598.1 amino acid permease [Tersicoccus phoenicis]
MTAPGQASRSARADNPYSVLRRKPIGEIEPEVEEHSLKRTLGLWQLTAIGVGGIIGAGIFSLAGAVANGKAGPAVLLSFLIAGVASAAAAFSYAEFAGMVPKAGSAYTYGYAGLGEIVGWFIGWDLLLEYIAIVAVVAIGISGYFGFLVGQIGIDLPPWMLGAPGTGEGHVVDLFAMVLCLLTAFILTRGISSAARAEMIFVVLKVALVLLIVVLGAFQINTANYTPYFPFGFSGVMAGAATVFFAVFGYDAMSTAAEESKDATKHMPKAILYSLAIAMALYVLATLVLTGMQKYTEIDPTSGFASAFNSVGLPVVANIIAVGAIISILTVMITFMLGVTRVWFSMSRDGLLPEWFAKTDTRRKVPVRVTWLAGIGSAIIAGVLPIEEAAGLTNIGILSAFVVVCIAVIVLRYRRPDLPREFRAPLMPITPAVGVLFSLWLIVSIQNVETYIRFVVWLAVGLAIYFLYSRRNSVMNPDSPRRSAATQPGPARR